jgi:hypothetical protein
MQTFSSSDFNHKSEHFILNYSIGPAFELCSELRRERRGSWRTGRPLSSVASNTVADDARVLLPHQVTRAKPGFRRAAGHRN